MLIKMMNKISAWLGDIIVYALVAFLIMVIINLVIVFSVQNDFFGTLSSTIDQLWSQLMLPIGLLLGITLIMKHRPYFND